MGPLVELGRSHELADGLNDLDDGFVLRVDAPLRVLEFFCQLLVALPGVVTSIAAYAYAGLRITDGSVGVTAVPASAHIRHEFGLGQAQEPGHQCSVRARQNGAPEVPISDRGTVNAKVACKLMLPPTHLSPLLLEA